MAGEGFDASKFMQAAADRAEATPAAAPSSGEDRGARETGLSGLMDRGTEAALAAAFGLGAAGNAGYRALERRVGDASASASAARHQNAAEEAHRRDSLEQGLARDRAQQAGAAERAALDAEARAELDAIIEGLRADTRPGLTEFERAYRALLQRGTGPGAVHDLVQDGHGGLMEVPRVGVNYEGRTLSIDEWLSNHNGMRRAAEAFASPEAYARQLEAAKDYYRAFPRDNAHANEMLRAFDDIVAGDRAIASFMRDTGVFNDWKPSQALGRAAIPAEALERIAQHGMPAIPRLGIHDAVPAFRPGVGPGEAAARIADAEALAGRTAPAVVDGMTARAHELAAERELGRVSGNRPARPLGSGLLTGLLGTAAGVFGVDAALGGAADAVTRTLPSYVNPEDKAFEDWYRSRGTPAQ